MRKSVLDILAGWIDQCEKRLLIYKQALQPLLRDEILLPASFALISSGIVAAYIYRENQFATSQILTFTLVMTSYLLGFCETSRARFWGGLIFACNMLAWLLTIAVHGRYR